MERWSSWFKAPVLKTGEGESLPWVRIPLSPPHIQSKCIDKWRSTQVAEGEALLKL